MQGEPLTGRAGPQQDGQQRCGDAGRKRSEKEQRGPDLTVSACSFFDQNLISSLDTSLKRMPQQQGGTRWCSDYAPRLSLHLALALSPLGEPTATEKCTLGISRGVQGRKLEKQLFFRDSQKGTLFGACSNSWSALGPRGHVRSQR